MGGILTASIPEVKGKNRKSQFEGDSKAIGHATIGRNSRIKICYSKRYCFFEINNEGLIPMFPDRNDNSKARAVYSTSPYTGVGAQSYSSVVKNTYLLLGLTLAFSAVCAYFSMAAGAPQLGLLVTLVGVYGLMFLTYKLSNSAWGLLSVFAFTGFMGYTLGPLLNMVTANFSNGSQIIMNAFGGTALIFFALSGYVLTTRKDFSFMGGFLVAGTLVALVAVIAGFFFHTPALQLGISSLFVLLSSGWILWQTSEIIHGGETNYIRATIGLYVQIYNLFVSLIQLITAFSGNND